MYKIGEFSKITNLSVKTLRYYNEIGLLLPEEVDIYTGYRYYGDRNLEEVKLIKELKGAGFTLEEIINKWNKFTIDDFENKSKELYQKQMQLDESIKKVNYLKTHLFNGKIVNYELNNNKVKKL